MDYGKLAYLKAVDLEDRLSGERRSSFSVSSRAHTDIPSGRQVLATLDGETVAVFIKASSTGTFFVDDVKIAEGSDVFFSVSGGGTISVESEGIERLDMLVLGDVTAVESPARGYADFNGDTLAYMVCDKGLVTVFSTPISSFLPSKVFEESGVGGDITAYEDGFIYAVLGSDGSVTTIYDGKRKKYDLGATRVSINSHNEALTIAFVKDGEAFYIEPGTFGSDYAAISKVGYRNKIDDLRLVRKGTKLLFSSLGKCYICELGASLRCDDTVTVELVSEVS